ncbi:MAG: coenzyme F420-0:L-glutamate ligase [Rhodobacteraceae bacterium]|nr:MAG: coenzyme F420-0:L-glutamate ligase [Paracoccaceae bacterium]
MAVALITLPGFPTVRPGDDLAALACAAASGGGVAFEDGDIVVFAQKIVSKAEGRTIRLDRVKPSPRARELAEATEKDPRLVEAVLAESVEVLRAKPGVLVVEHRLGHVMANAGVDRSNLDAENDEEVALLLPLDPDRSAAALRARLQAEIGRRVGVIVSDSFGRAWRRGVVGVALGVAGPPAVIDRRGDPDRSGRPLQVTEVGFADAVAAAAVLAMGEGAEGTPVVVVRGVDWPESAQTARDGLRPRAQDLFR